MNNIHPLISKLLNDWRQSSAHPRQAKTDALVAKANQGVPLATKDKDAPNVADDTKANRRSEGTDKWQLNQI